MPFAVLATLALPSLAFAQLQVVTTTPLLNGVASPSGAISVEFDRALDTSTVNASSFRVFGQWSGTLQGTFSFSNGNKTATLTPGQPLSAGELVYVNLSRDLVAADTSTFRSEGYAFQFRTSVVASAAAFEEIDSFTNKTGPQTRIYGAAAGDLNNDGYLDLATVNEVSADVRVFLNQADGSGLFGPMLPAQPIGIEASPNATADFDNDGNIDLVVGAADTDDAWIMLGAGDGTFSSVVGKDMGASAETHGVAALDVDGDADLDIVAANVSANNLALMINNGSGVFGAPTFFDAGVHGEYALQPADMDGDGITDLVVGARDGQEIVTLLGNGNGTFTAAGTPQSSGGATWILSLGDIDGDGIMDVAAANDGSANIGILINQGDGTFDPVTTVGIGHHVPSVDLGDLDGDGDVDMVVSSFGGGFWEWYRNDGTGTFESVDAFVAPDNPSCAVLFDFDNDGDLDMALTDEIADVVILMRNGSAASLCSSTPANCRRPTEGGKSKLILKDKSPDDADTFIWKWTKGAATSKAEFGNPPGTDGYALCLYEDDALVLELSVPAGGTCNGSPCWKDIPAGFSYKDKGLTPDGVLSAKLLEGIDGAAKIKLKAKGLNVNMPDLAQLTGVLDVQLQRTNDPACWGATYTPPFKKAESDLLKASSDAPPSVLPIWSEIHANVIGPTCGGCHGGSGGLSGLSDCNTAHTALVNVASTELPTMDRIEPGDSTMSWIMHKLDGTQGDFTGMCSGSCGAQMPFGGPYLDLEVRDAIRTWIDDGAANDCP
jgi:hypothetical protein